MAGTRAGQYDIAVIGGGPAGLAIAEVAPRLGVRMAIIEAAKLGGDCTWSGCVPSKALLAAGNARQRGRSAERFGLPGFEERGAVDLGAVMDRVHDHQQGIFERADAPELLRERGIDVIEGRATFEGPERVVVGGAPVDARYFVIATGASAAVPPIPGLAEAGYLTNETVWELRELPERLLVIGGGAVGLELGQAFGRLGSGVTIVEAAAEVLPTLDGELASELRGALEADGVAVHTGATVRAIEGRAGGPCAIVETASAGTIELPTDRVLVATGRVPNVAGLGLEAAGVAYDARAGITVDGNMRTSNPRVYAAGDVIPGPQFTHTAAMEGVSAMMSAVLLMPRPLDPRLVPVVTFTSPETASIGLTEAEARARYDDVRVRRAPLLDSDRATVDQAPPGFMKVVTRGKSERIEGAQIVAPAAGEVIHEFGLAMREGLGLRDLAELPHAYPSYAMSVQMTGIEAMRPWMASGSVQRFASFARRVPGERLRGALRSVFRRIS